MPARSPATTRSPPSWIPGPPSDRLGSSYVAASCKKAPINLRRRGIMLSSSSRGEIMLSSDSLRRRMLLTTTPTMPMMPRRWAQLPVARCHRVPVLARVEEIGIRLAKVFAFFFLNLSAESAALTVAAGRCRRFFEGLRKNPNESHKPGKDYKVL